MLSSLLVLALAQSGAGRSEQEVFLHIESNRPGLELARVTSVGTGAVATSRGVAYVSMINMTKECAAPCDRLLARPEDTFMVGGPGATTSDAFTLAGRGESVTLKVNAGSAGLRETGFSGEPNPYGRGLLDDMGYWGLIGGGVALAGGIPLFAFNGTRVEFLPRPGGLGAVCARAARAARRGSASSWRPFRTPGLPTRCARVAGTSGADWKPHARPGLSLGLRPARPWHCPPSRPPPRCSMWRPRCRRREAIGPSSRAGGARRRTKEETKHRS